MFAGDDTRNALSGNKSVGAGIGIVCEYICNDGITAGSDIIDSDDMSCIKNASVNPAFFLNNISS
jgi:hypothetical protein